MEILNEGLTKNQASGTIAVDECTPDVCNRRTFLSMLDSSEPALVHHIVFSDSVIREAGTGKLSFIGTFGAFNAPRFPLRVPIFYVTPKITNVSGVRELKVTIRIEVPDSGMVVASAAATVRSERGFERDADIDIPFPMPGVVFQQAGIYHVTVLLNNENVGKRPVKVVAVTATPQIEIKGGDEP